ncbi:MAG TPA: hypothetical protein VGL12_04585 [Roseiarcus sp.]|jgi:hypothetical protein
MNTSPKAPRALGFILAIPLFALPAHGAPAHDTGHEPAQHRVADFSEARAFVSPATPVAQAPETDGLSRKDEECNFGCVDH